LTFIATQSMPTVSNRPAAWATRSLVPTPSVEMAMPRSGETGITLAKKPTSSAGRAAPA
jgi:hypothetical protein